MSIIENHLEYIEEKLGSLSLKTIANNLGKNVNTLEMMLHRKKGFSSTKIQTGMITAGKLSKILKVDRNTVIGWIERHGLKCTKRITHSKTIFTFIDIEHFWEWCFTHLDKVDISKIEHHSLPPQPLWVNQERKRKKKVSNYKTWTKQEERRLLELKESGNSIEEIAILLDRTKNSVEKKFSRIKLL